MALPDLIRDASAYSRTQPDYAGRYIDHDAGGVMVFLFSGDLTNHASELGRRMPGDATFRVERVERSRSDLETLRSDVHAAYDELMGLGVRVVSTGIKTDTNTLLVGIAPDSSQGAETLMARFGPGVSVRTQGPVQADACTFGSCWPLKGGFKITSTTSCTSGFVSKSEFGSITLLTAGHCIYVGGIGTDWKHATNTIGPGQTHTWYSGADADAAILYLLGSAIPSTKNQYMVTNGTVRSLTAVRESADQDVDDVVCRTGIASNLDCGKIVAIDVTNNSCISNNTICRAIDHTWELDFDSTGGDSGGPIHAGTNIGLGIHVHSDVDGSPNARSWYSPLGWVRTEYFNRHGIFYSYCLNAGCSVTWP